MQQNAFQKPQQGDVANETARQPIYRKALGLEEKGARFPGFQRRKVNYHKGQQVVSGALTLQHDLVCHESTSMILEDGVQLCSDVFLPAEYDDISATNTNLPKLPALIAWSPYGKQGGTTKLDDFPFRAGVPREWTSGLEKWEGPDPAFWCPHKYAVVNVDSRGAYTSGGDLLILGHQEAHDAADFATWASEQPWCNGKVAFTGNSWLTIVQWKLGSLRPKGLAALAPWEGFQDLYREHLCVGGIPFPSFVEELSSKLASKGKLEDIPAKLRDKPLLNEYWEDKRANVERIQVPTYVVASWSNPIHNPGTLNAWSNLPVDTPKWLRVHNTQEWSDYYTDASRKDLKRFFDYYLHDRTDNGWQCTPRVRLSVYNFGLGTQLDTVDRPEEDFPLPRTEYTQYYLSPDKTLSSSSSGNSKHAASGPVDYDSSSGKAVFDHVMPSSCETTGYFSAHLVMSTPSHTEMDIFVQVEKLSPRHKRQGVLCINPHNAVVRRVFKLMHNWQIGTDKAGPVFYWGPSGMLRASHALDRDDALSRPARPVYTHKRRVLLEKGEKRVLDVAMKPVGMYWEKGDILRFTVSGKEIIPFPIPGTKPPETDNRGVHIIHCHDREEESSYLLVPHV